MPLYQMTIQNFTNEEEITLLLKDGQRKKEKKRVPLVGYQKSPMITDVNMMNMLNSTLTLTGIMFFG